MLVVDGPCRTPAGCKQIHGGPCEVAVEAPIEERCACCSGSSPTTGARCISRASNPTASLLKSRDQFLAPIGSKAHRREATARRKLPPSGEKGGVFAKVELAPALDEAEHRPEPTPRLPHCVVRVSRKWVSHRVSAVLGCRGRRFGWGPPSRQAAASVNWCLWSFRMLWVALISRHSVRTAERPRLRNRPIPRLDFVCANTGSIIPWRLR